MLEEDGVLALTVLPVSRLGLEAWSGPLGMSLNFFNLLFLAVLGLQCCTGFSLIVASWGYSLLWCAGFSLQWLLWLWSTGSRALGFSSCGSRAQAQ